MEDLLCTRHKPFLHVLVIIVQKSYCDGYEWLPLTDEESVTLQR